MMQGVLVNHRVRLLLDKDSKCYRPRRPGERKRKSVRGAITGPDLSVLALVVSKKGEGEIPGLTDVQVPRRLGPKRASKIRKLFGLTKKDDVRKYVVRRKLPKKPEGRGKAPKIQRLVTPTVLQRKRRRMALKRKWAEKSRSEATDYAKLLAQRRKDARSKRLSSKRRSSLKRDSTSAASGGVAPSEKPQAIKAAQATKGTAPAAAVQRKQGPGGGARQPPQGDKAATAPAGSAGKKATGGRGTTPAGGVTKTKGGGAGELGGAGKRAK